MRTRLTRRKRRTRRRIKSLSNRLLMVLLSICTSGLMLVGLAIYAESQPTEPAEGVVQAESAPEMADSPVQAADDAAPDAEEPEDAPEPEPAPDATDIPASEPTDEPVPTDIPPDEAEPTQAPMDIPAEHTDTPVTTIAPTPDPVATPAPADPTDAPVPTQEPLVTPDPVPTDTPTSPPDTTSAPSPDPTDIPTLPPDPTATPSPDPTTEPTPTPVPSSYKLYITPPTGWYTDKANVQVRLVDENQTGWYSVHVRIGGDGAWIDITHRFANTDTISLEITDNNTLYVSIVDPVGKTYNASKYIACFDREIPAVRAGLTDGTLRVEARDNLSGVAAIWVCGYRFTDLDNNVLHITLRDYADNYQHIFYQAEDNVGNLSKIRTMKNPYYNPSLPTPQPTATPAPTPAPTSPGSGGGNGGSGNGGGGNATATPSATPKPEEPDATFDPSESPEPFDTELPPSGEPAPEPTIHPGTGFSNNGNAVMRDLLYDKHTNKQFLRMETREGATYYIVIDYDKPLDEEGDSYETYFLNMVDARDLFDVVAEEDLPEQYAATPTPMPTEVPIPTAEPTQEPPEATPEPEPEPEKEGGGGIISLLALLLVGGGGGALWFFKFRKPQGKAKQAPDFDDYDDYDDEDDDDADGDT